MKRSGFKQKLTVPMKRTRLRKKSNSPLAKLKEKLWQLCRQIVKLQHPHICFTCGKPLVPGQNDFHTGHFISSSICSTYMRYYLGNLRPQCSGCNVWKSGNWLAFEIHLKAENGENYVVELKELNERTKGQKYDELWYKQKIQEYEELLKQYEIL